MDTDKAYKHCISCTNVPAALLLKAEAKVYFGQFGKLVRLHLRPRSGTCRIQYINEECVDRAISEAGEYKGQMFSVIKSEKPKLKPMKSPNLTWVADPDVQAELEAMEGIGKYHFRNEGAEAKIEKKRVWPTTQKKVKKPQEQVFSIPSEQRELFNILKQPALSVEEQFRTLDARDKLIRLRTQRQADLKTRVTVGTCPDMCPEKERLMRETQHQVALYEQEPSSKTMNPHIAVKQYSRSSADQESPLPHELRPVSVLQMTMGYLMHSIIDLCDNPDVNLGDWYHFLWDRTRGIRKDITQQELCCQGSVELVEQCARFHIHCSARLVAEDPSVFDHKINTENLTKCLQTLKYMYHDLRCKKVSCPNEAEFRAYIILLNLNDGNFMWEVQQLRPEIQKSKEITFSLAVYSALDTNNYVKFFKLVRQTTYLNACILLRYFIQVRVNAIRTIIKAFTPRVNVTSYPLSEIRDILAFEGNASTRDFLEYYGLNVNENATHIVLARSSFMLPELPYALDRAINIVESKRHFSVGEIICGGVLPPKIFETHVPHTSFDVHGYLNTSEFADVDFIASNDEEFKKLDSRSNSPFDTVDNAKVKPVFKAENVFGVKPESKSVSGQKENIFEVKKSIFGQKPKTEGSGNVFGYREDTDSQDSIEKNLGFGNPGFVSKNPIFGKKIDDQAKTQSVFGTRPPQESIFGQRSQDSEGFSQKSQDSIFGNKTIQTKNIFGQQSTQENKPSMFAQNPQEKSSFGKEKSIFGQQKPPSQNIFTQKPPERAERPKTPEKNNSPYGGFNFELKISEKQKLGLQRKKAEEETRKKQEEEFQKKREQELRKKKLEAEEQKRRDFEERQRLEAQSKLDEERKKLEEARRRKLEEDRRRHEVQLEHLRLAEIRKAEALEKQRLQEIQRLEEIRRSEEIKSEVKLIVNELVTIAEETYKKDRLSSILNSITKRKMVYFVNKWKNNMVIRKRKRKAIDDWPIWLNSSTVDEEAKQLIQVNQSQVLMDIKRYKSGVCRDLKISETNDVRAIDFREIAAKVLKRYLDLNRNDNHVFWKVNVSLPGVFESKHNLKRIEGYVYSLLNWDDNSNSLIETKKISGKKVTYCIKKHDKFYNDDPCDGYIFLNDFVTQEFLDNIENTIKNFNFKPSVALVIILNEINDSEKVISLFEKYVITDFKIIPKLFTATNLELSLKQGFEYLAEKIPKPPTLELDNFKTFLIKYLATELWDRINSFAKFNRPYGLCLTDPKIVYNLYREALAKLENLVFDNSRFKIKNFPKEFETTKPNYLPCDYKYFPAFWKNDSYNRKLQRIFDELKFRSFDISWPPVDETHLEKIVYQIAQTFENCDTVFYKIMGVILRKLEDLGNFDDVKYMIWTDIIEIIILEKIKEFDFELRDPFVSDFDELFVVYDSTELQKFNTDMWFYLSNTSIENNIDCTEHIPDESEEEIIYEDDDIDLEKTFTEAMSYDEKYDENMAEGKSKIKDLEMLMKDLEDSVRIQKKISSKFQETLTYVLDKD